MFELKPLSQKGIETAFVKVERYRLLGELKREFDRAYYSGIVQERRAKELLAHGTLGVGPAVYELLVKAMDH